MKKISLITLLTLLSTGLGLHAGCWMPESDTVKNYYKGIDGGYIKVTSKDDPNIYYLRLQGKIRRIMPHRSWIWRYIFMPKWTIEQEIVQPLKKEGTFLLFLPKGFAKRKFVESYNPGSFGQALFLHERYLGFKPDAWLIKVIKKEWPHLTDISTALVNIYDFPCYKNTTYKAFEEFKKNPGKTIKEKKEEREERKRARIRKKSAIE